MVIKGVPCKSTLLIICILFYKETMFQCELLWYDNFHRFFHIHNKQRKLKQPQQLWYISLFYVQCCKNSLQNFLRVCNHPVKWHTITSFNGQIHVWPVVLQLECFGVGSLTYFIALTTATAMLSHFSRVRSLGSSASCSYMFRKRWHLSYLTNLRSSQWPCSSKTLLDEWAVSGTYIISRKHLITSNVYTL